MEKILEVKNLKISFRTSGGTVKAVRDISFDLEKGKTVAIVGESGSGKSVTSKAIMGILAGNAIVEGGEILYDGRDLLRISEEEMCKIRGDRISMIFQDPLSSLNPIVKVGNQLTEAMLLKNAGNRKKAKKEFETILALLKESCTAGANNNSDVAAAVETFEKFNAEATQMENSYNTALAAADGLQVDMDEFLFLVEKKQKVDPKARVKEFAAVLKTVKDPFLTRDADAELEAIIAGMQQALAVCPKNTDNGLPQEVISVLDQMKRCLETVTARTRPDFFCIGFYKMKNPEADLGAMSVESLNAEAARYLNEHFMKDFLTMVDKGTEYSYNTALEKKKAVMADLKEAYAFFKDGKYDKKTAMEKCKAITEKVEASIDPLEIVKDSRVYTFRTSLEGSLQKYFQAVVRNPKEEARFAKQTRRREALIAKGRTVDWKVVPKSVYDLDELQAEITTVISRLMERFEDYIANSANVDFRSRSTELVEYFKSKASQMVYIVTKKMAREKAIELMEEVGIPEPHIRYYQYPFSFSGGMRQRIVIAIALAADPEILICDEPTTALDVTIQAQILELINRLKVERNLSVIFITHDLGVVANMADEIAVLYAGKIVEYGTAEDVFYDPRHPYTWALLSSMPDLETTEKLDAIPGTPPNMIYPPEGDAFADRNKYAMKIDFERQPPQFAVSDTHWAATWLLHPDAPKVDPPKIITDRIARMNKAGGNNA
ncbi:MAG: ATP-binding cassette domain-containing protein [Clostridia bacterium]|nr:ATP-binding cassette domain-containing protein [Clostridia bacterium]